MIIFGGSSLLDLSPSTKDLLGDTGPREGFHGAAMTSVTCSACNQSIVSESDRVYCFGGCEQILHTRCSELTVSAAAAVRDNVAVKYLCFGCRKQQTCINEINKKCTDLLHRVNAMNNLVSKHDVAFANFDTHFYEKVEGILLPRLLAAINPIQMSPADCNTCVVAPKQTYAAVVSEPMPNANAPVTANNDKRIEVNKSSAKSGAATMDSNLSSGLLRSGKRRNLGHANSTRITTCTALAIPNPRLQDRGTPLSSTSRTVPPTPNLRPSTTPRKSAAVTRIEQTVLIKPKCKQTSETTQKDVHRKLDPAKFSVKAAIFKDDGEAVIRCDTCEDAQKLADTATTLLSEKYVISIQKPLKPRIKVFGLSDDLTPEEILTKLARQNNLAESHDLKIIRLQKAKSRKSNPIDAILEVDARSFEHLIRSKRVNIGWNRCKVVEVVNVLRCYNCSAYGHKASSCSSNACCPKCSGDHNADECEADFVKCVNCERLNKDRKSPYDEIVDVNHSAWGTDCPIYRKREKIAKQRIDYST